MKRGTRTFQIALGGIFLALTLIFLWGSSFAPGVEMTLLAISSLFVGFMLLETGIGGAALLFVAASLLGFILLPNKVAIIPYVLIFGYYGILKYFIEKIPSAAVQIITKAAYFAVMLTIIVVGLANLLTTGSTLSNSPVWAVIVVGVVMLMVYDYIYSCIIRFYVVRVQHKGIDNMKLS